MTHSLKTHLISAGLTALAAFLGYVSTTLLNISIPDLNIWQFSEIAIWALTIAYRAFLKEILTPQNGN